MSSSTMTGSYQRLHRFAIVSICSWTLLRIGVVALAPMSPRCRCRPHSRPLAAPAIAVSAPLRANKWDREIEEAGRRRAAAGGGGGGATVAGAILGGLLAGPFGAIFGASIGSNIGARSALDRARQEEMERLGIDPTMLAAAQEVGEALERANEGLVAVQDSLSSLQRFAGRLEADANKLYDSAKAAIADKNEDKAKQMLLERHSTMEKLKTVLKDCVEMKKKLETMERNVAVLETKAVEIETLLQRTVGAKAMSNVGALGLTLSDEDPLLRKFRDLGID